MGSPGSPDAHLGQAAGGRWGTHAEPCKSPPPRHAAIRRTAETFKATPGDQPAALYVMPAPRVITKSWLEKEKKGEGVNPSARAEM